MSKIKSLFFLLCMSLISLAGMAQGDTGFGETMRSNGRIYVVVAVLVTILIGIFLYLFRLERKISKAEKDTQ